MTWQDYKSKCKDNSTWENGIVLVHVEWLNIFLLKCSLPARQSSMEERKADMSKLDVKPVHQTKQKESTSHHDLSNGQSHDHWLGWSFHFRIKRFLRLSEIRTSLDTFVDLADLVLSRVLAHARFPNAWRPLARVLPCGVTRHTRWIVSVIASLSLNSRFRDFSKHFSLLTLDWFDRHV